MISADSHSNEMAASASTFSYAQAAKGQGTSPAPASPNPASSQPQGSQETPSPAATDAPVESSEKPQSNDVRPSQVEKQDIDSNIGSESDLRSEATHDRRSESKRDEDSNRLDRPWRRTTDKGTRSSSTATRLVDEQETRRPRKGKKSKASSDKQSGDQSSADKEKEAAQEAPKIELSEAPIPSVNIWLQRKEQQQSKPKPAVTETTSNGVSAHDGESKKPTKDTTSVAPSKENAVTNGVKSHRKAGESGRPERNGARGARSTDKDAKDGKTELPPPVEDATAWPTPEIAIKEEKKKPATDKPAAPVAAVPEPQDDGSQGKPRPKEKWVAYDYVPTVNFETQLPQMRNSKPRGGARNTNSTRATAGSQTSEKSATNATATKSSESKDRSRESGAAANRTNSLPPTSKRASMDGSSTTKEQKKTASQAGDKAKDAASAPSTEPNHNSRAEGRAERGRGGYRGRGAHHAVNTHGQHQQHNNGNFAAGGSVPSRPQNPYSPPPRQGPHGQMFMPPAQRGGRGRSNAGNNFHRMSLPNGASRLPHLQAQFGSYEYPMAPMSAVPFQPQPYWDNVVMTLLKNQVEYYFSIENLCKDMYLRKRMDSQGFVNLHFIAAFKRIRELTADMGMIRAVCEASTEIEYVSGEDDIERLRRRSGWQSFVLPMEDRDDFARNNGPSHLTFKNRPFNYGSQFNGNVPVPFGMPPPMAFSPQGDAQFAQFPDAMPAGQPVNGLVNGHGPVQGSTQLSADVPDFSPSSSNSAQQDADKNATAKTNTHEDKPVNGLVNGVHAE